MITHKQFPNHKVYEMEIGGRPFTVETGKVAELANAECICRYGDTVVLVTCTCNPIPNYMETIYSGISTLTDSYHLRPRELMISAQYSF